MKTRKFCQAVCLVLSLPGAGASVEAGNIYTCTDDKGRKSFSDRPCPVGAEQSSKKPDASARQQKSSEKQHHKATGSYGGFVNRARGVEKKLDKTR